MRRAALVAVLILAAGSSAPAQDREQPAIPDVSGEWSGSIRADNARTISTIKIRVYFRQDGRKIVGDWSRVDGKPLGGPPSHWGEIKGTIKTRNKGHRLDAVVYVHGPSVINTPCYGRGHAGGSLDANEIRLFAPRGFDTVDDCQPVPKFRILLER